jgi:hypothetical protein
LILGRIVDMVDHLHLSLLQNSQITFKTGYDGIFLVCPIIIHRFAARKQKLPWKGKSEPVDT